MGTASASAAAGTGAGRQQPVWQRMQQQAPAQQQLSAAQQQQQIQQSQDPRVKRFMARVRLALLDCCQVAIAFKQHLLQEGRVSSSHIPKFPLEKLEEAFLTRFVCVCVCVDKDNATLKPEGQVQADRHTGEGEAGKADRWQQVMDVLVGRGLAVAGPRWATSVRVNTCVDNYNATCVDTGNTIRGLPAKQQ
jgi:hypothetical protein